MCTPQSLTLLMWKVRPEAVCVASVLGDGCSRGAVMSLQFTDEEFQEAWRELDEPQLEGGWELFTETMGVKIYRLLDKVGKINQSAAFTTGRTVLPQSVRIRLRFRSSVCSVVTIIDNLYKNWCEIIIFNVINVL